MEREQVLTINEAVKTGIMPTYEGTKQLSALIAKDAEDMYVMVLEAGGAHAETAKTLATIHRRLDSVVHASAEFSVEIACVALALMTCIRTGPQLTDELMKAVTKFMEDRDARILQEGD